MSVYTIPQDVETEDHVIGPFGMRQLIYLGIAAGFLALAWVFFTISPVLCILPVPIVLFFLLIALPLRKEQPTENWVASIIKFRLNPQKKFWQNDGQESFVTIEEAMEVDEVVIKDITGEEAEKRISFLSQLVDTEGWMTRGLNSSNSAVSNDVMMESNAVIDMFDSTHSATVNSELAQSQSAYRQDLVNQMQGNPVQYDSSSYNIPANNAPSPNSIAGGIQNNYGNNYQGAGNATNQY